MNEPEQSVDLEHKQHTYVGHRVPWYVHVIWLSFWIFAIAYTIAYLIPAMRHEFVKPP